MSFIPRRPGFEYICIPAYSAEMLVPQPLDTLSRAFHPGPIGAQLCMLPPFLKASLVVPFHKPRAHEQNIAGAELGALSRGDGFEVGVGDGVAGDGGVGDAVGLGVGEIVQEDGAADDAAVLGPFWRLLLFIVLLLFIR